MSRTTDNIDGNDNGLTNTVVSISPSGSTQIPFTHTGLYHLLLKSDQSAYAFIIAKVNPNHSPQINRILQVCPPNCDPCLEVSWGGNLLTIHHNAFVRDTYKVSWWGLV